MHGLVCRYPHIALRKGLLIFFTVKRQTVSIVGLGEPYALCHTTELCPWSMKAVINNM